MSFEIVSAQDLAEANVALRAPSADMQRYIDYVRQIVATARPDAIGRIKPDSGGAPEDLMREANNTVQRVKRAAVLAGANIIVTKTGSDVYFRLPQEGEAANAGPDAPKRPRQGSNGSPVMSVRDFQNLSAEEQSSETESAEAPAESGEEEEAAAGRRRR